MGILLFQRIIRNICLIGFTNFKSRFESRFESMFENRSQ